MAWIETLDREDASGFIETVYEQFSRGEEETISNIVKAHSLNDRAMKAFAAFSELLFTDTHLDRRTKEMINTVVSVHNECHYWTEQHGEFLRQVTRDEALVEQLKEDYRQADLTDRERAILDYAVKLTETPSGMTEQDVEALRKVGLSDGEILEVVEIASWFNYINRVADALNVQLEPDFGERPAPGVEE